MPRRADARMNFAEIKAALAKLPAAEREWWRAALEHTHDDGFGRGAGHCPRENPFSLTAPAEPEKKRRR